ncbi:MAG TPA: hypothetical protein VGB85_23325, partial [Nannocystis sp.]
MSPLTNLRTSPLNLPLACVVALSLLAPAAAAAPGRAYGPVLVNMFPGPAPAGVSASGHLYGTVLANVSLGPASTGASPPAPTSEPAKAACPAAQEAIAGTSADKYGEAARQFEQCARTSGDAGLWKKAGMARYSARQYAHAIQALDIY